MVFDTLEWYKFKERPIFFLRDGRLVYMYVQKLIKETRTKILVNKQKHAVLYAVRLRLFSFFCLTPSFFVSSTSDLDICFPNPCKNNGVCKDVQGTAKCDCPPPHKGPFCTGLIHSIRVRLRN